MLRGGNRLIGLAALLIWLGVIFSPIIVVAQDRDQEPQKSDIPQLKDEQQKKDEPQKKDAPQKKDEPPTQQPKGQDTQPQQPDQQPPTATPPSALPPAAPAPSGGAAVTQQGQTGQTNVTPAANTGGDAGAALGNTAGSGVEVQRRSPIAVDPRIRGYHFGQIVTIADGAFFMPARLISIRPSARSTRTISATSESSRAPMPSAMGLDSRSWTSRRFPLRDPRTRMAASRRRAARASVTRATATDFRGGSTLGAAGRIGDFASATMSWQAMITRAAAGYCCRQATIRKLPIWPSALTCPRTAISNSSICGRYNTMSNSPVCSLTSMS